jgi:hypothetical protein
LRAKVARRVQPGGERIKVTCTVNMLAKILEQIPGEKRHRLVRIKLTKPYVVIVEDGGTWMI